MVTTVLLFCRTARPTSRSTCRSRCGCGSRCCLRTSPRRWRKGAARRRPTRCARRSRETTAYQLRADGKVEEVPSSHLRVNDKVRVVAGQMIPGDGEVIEGVASVDESAITGESAPVIREAGGDRVGGDRRNARAQRHDRGAHYSESRRDVSGPHDRAGGRRGAAEDAQRDCAEYSAGRADDYLSSGGGHAGAVRGVLGRAADGVCADLAAGVPDSDDHRRAAVGDWDCGHGPPGAAQCAGRQRARGGGRGRREYAAAGQDGDHHAGQPAGLGVPDRGGRHGGRAGGRGAALVAARRDAGGPLDRGAGQGAVRPARARAGEPECGVHPVQRD